VYFGHWVKTRWPKGAAPQQPLGAEPKSAGGAMKREGFVGERRARRGEPARRWSPRPSSLVKLNCQQATLIEGALGHETFCLAVVMSCNMV